MRLWILVPAILVIVALSGLVFWILRPGGTPLVLDYYRIVDADSINVGTSTGAGVETRVTNVLETSDSVTITVQRFQQVFGLTRGGTHPIELTVDLDQPVGDRRVFDPHHEVPRAENGP
jgi:hypothetical protein